MRRWAQCQSVAGSNIHSLCFRQGEDIDGVTHQRAIALKGEHAAGPDLRTAAIIAGWNGHELFAVDHEGCGKTLRGRAEPGRPQGLARLHVERPEGAVPVPD